MSSLCAYTGSFITYFVGIPSNIYIFTHHLNKILDALCFCWEKVKRERWERERACALWNRKPIIIREHRETPGRKVVWASLKVKLCCRYFIKNKSCWGSLFFFFCSCTSYRTAERNRFLVNRNELLCRHSNPSGHLPV